MLFGETVGCGQTLLVHRTSYSVTDGVSFTGGVARRVRNVHQVVPPSFVLRLPALKVAGGRHARSPDRDRRVRLVRRQSVHNCFGIQHRGEISCGIQAFHIHPFNAFMCAVRRGETTRREQLVRVGANRCGRRHTVVPLDNTLPGGKPIAPPIFSTMGRLQIRERSTAGLVSTRSFQNR